MLQIKLLGHNVCLRSLQDIYFASHRAEKGEKKPMALNIFVH